MPVDDKSSSQHDLGQDRSLGERTSVLLIEALASVWSKIRERHPDVPGVVLLAAPAARDRMNVLGHFAALRWSARRRRKEQENNQHLHEVVVVAEHLDRPAEDIVETLLHEAAHAMNFELGIYDCSASQYHNRQFRNAAANLGLEVQQVPHYGFALSRLPEETAAIYKEEINQLKEVLVHRRKLVSLGGQTPKPPSVGTDDGETTKGQSRSRKATCACPFIIRVAKATLENTTIRCESCGEAFRLV